MSAPTAPQPANDSGNAIDLGGPVYESPSPSAGPLSGAAFVAWSSRLNRMVKPLGSEGPRSNATAAAGGAGDEGSAMIDLGDPVTNPVGDKGPPSGASFVAWSSLAKKKAEQAAAAGATPSAPDTVAAHPRTVATPSATKVAPAAAGSDRYAWLALGVVLGVALSVALWAAGFEPPQGLRSWHQPAPSSQP